MTRDEVIAQHTPRRCTGHCCQRFTLPFKSIEEMHPYGRECYYAECTMKECKP